MRKRYLVCFIIALALLLSGCKGGGGPTTPIRHVTILEESWSKEYNEDSERWNAEVTAVAVNDGQVTLEYAEIWCRWLDTSEQVIVDRVATTENWPRNQTWNLTWRLGSNTEPGGYELWVGTLT